MEPRKAFYNQFQRLAQPLSPHLNDFTISLLILVSITGLRVLPAVFGSGDYISGISQGITTGTVVLLALFSYRYAVKSNIRSAVNEIQSMKIGEYRIEPTVYDIKWRPKIGPWQRHTAIKYNIYREKKDEIYPLDATQFFSESGIDPNILSDLSDIYSEDRVYEWVDPDPEEDNWVRNFREVTTTYTADPNINASAIHATYDTTSGYQIRRLVDRTLRRLRDELRS